MGNELGAKVAGDVTGFSSHTCSYFRQALLQNIQETQRERIQGLQVYFQLKQYLEVFNITNSMS